MGIYEIAIVKTLSYSSVFYYPLNKSELWRYLVWERKKSPQISSFFKCLNLLVEKKKISQIKNFYLLRKNYSWVGRREKEGRDAKYKILIASKVTKILRVIPTIVFIGLSGKLALGIAKTKDDIDLLIITKSDYLWLTRLIVVTILSFLGIRRKPDNPDVKNKICLNMFLDLGHLSLPKKERDLFSAHEISQMKPLFIRNNYYQEFISKNKWVKSYLPNSVRKVPRVSRTCLPARRVPQDKDTFFEQFARKFQLKYMRKKRTCEIIKKGYVRFHPQDAREWILPEYNKIIKKHVTCNM